MKPKKYHPEYGTLIYCEKDTTIFEDIKSTFIFLIISYIFYLVFSFFVFLIQSEMRYFLEYILRLELVIGFLFYGVTLFFIMHFVKWQRIAIYDNGILVIKTKKFIKKDNIKMIRLWKEKYGKHKKQFADFVLQDHKIENVEIMNEYYLIDKIIAENYNNIKVKISDSPGDEELRKLFQKEFIKKRR